MGQLLLHITFVLKANSDERVIIRDYKTSGQISLYDREHQLIPIEVSEQVNMKYVSLRRIGFQCDYVIKVPDTVRLIPLKNNEKACQISHTNSHYTLDNPASDYFEILYFENGYELWVNYPHSFLYQVADESYAKVGGLNHYKGSDFKYLDFKERNWDFDIFSMSVIDENLNTLYTWILN